MATNRLKVMTANVVTLAGQTFVDSTDFVQIMQRNGLNDILVNAPVQAITMTVAPAGSSQLVVSPIDDIAVGWMISSSLITDLTIITNILQTYSIPASTAFCDCSTNRVLPSTGKRLSTILNISPSLSHTIDVGTQFLLSVGVQTVLTLPVTPPSTQRGVVS